MIIIIHTYLGFCRPFLNPVSLRRSVGRLVGWSVVVVCSIARLCSHSTLCCVSPILVRCLQFILYATLDTIITFSKLLRCRCDTIQLLLLAPKKGKMEKNHHFMMTHKKYIRQKLSKGKEEKEGEKTD